MNKRNTRSRKKLDSQASQQNPNNSAPYRTQTEPGEHFIILRPKLAVKLGLNAALILGQLYYLTRNKVYYWEIDEDNRVWFKRTYRQWQQTFPWMSISSVRYWFTTLEQWGYIKSVMGQNCKYYALTPAGLALFPQGSVSLTITIEEGIEMMDEGVSDSDRGVSESDGGACQKLTPPHIYKDDSKEEEEDARETPPATADNADAPSLPSESFQDFVSKLADICSMNARLSSHRKRLETPAKEMWEAGYRCADLECVPLYWQNDDYRTGRIYAHQVVEIIEAAVRRYQHRLEAIAPPIEEKAPPKDIHPPDWEWQQTRGDLQKLLSAGTFAHCIRYLEWESFENGILVLRGKVPEMQRRNIAHVISHTYSLHSDTEVQQVVIKPPIDVAQPATAVAVGC